jgi:peptide/nickel transport system permease protein
VRTLGAALLATIVLMALLAPALTPHDPTHRFPDCAFAPPMALHVIDQAGQWRRPFAYPVRLVNRLERRFEEDRTSRMTLAWFSGGRIVRAASEDAGPWLPLGADSYGRDQWSRLLYGARTSLAVALVAVLGTLVIGSLVGGIAGLTGGWIDEGLMRLSDFVLVLPAMYVVLALRASLPLVLSSSSVFLLIGAIFSAIGWPIVARGVRSIVAVERTRDYAHAAVAAGAGPWRLLTRHLLPAAGGFLATQAALLVPAFVLAEATLSYVGLGFPDPVPSWGTMLQEAASAAALLDAPWTIAPAAAIFLTVLAVNLVVERPVEPGRDPGRRAIAPGRLPRER